MMRIQQGTDRNPSCHRGQVQQKEDSDFSGSSRGNPTSRYSPGPVCAVVFLCPGGQVSDKALDFYIVLESVL